MRGANDADSDVHSADDRFIPTGVGLMAFSRPLPWSGTVHPHVRGANQIAQNAFISQGDMIAKADAMTKEVRLWSKRELSRQDAASIVSDAGYTLLDIK